MAIGLGAALIGGALIGGASSVIGGSKASKAQQNAAAMQVAEQRRQYDQTRADYAPWREAGSSALDLLKKAYGIGGGTPDMSGFTTSPGYEFRRDEGIKAVERSAASRGLLRSGAAQKAIERYAEGNAAGEFDSWWNRLAGVAGVGMNATSGTAAAGSNAANAISNAYQQMGNAQAAGWSNAASSFNSGINGVLQAYLMTQKGAY